MSELTINQALQKAIEAHTAGKFVEADSFYTAILKAQPQHPDANHNMGVLALHMNRAQEALFFLKNAVEANPKVSQFWLSYLDALIKLDRLTDARAIFDKAKSIGIKADELKKLQEKLHISTSNVVGKTKKNGVRDDSNVLSTVRLGQAIKLAERKAKRGSSEEAKKIYQDILARFPMNKEAIGGQKKLTRKIPSSPKNPSNPSQVQLQKLLNLHGQGQFQETFKHCENLIQKHPNSAILFNIKGVVLYELGDYEEATEAYEKALVLEPYFAEASNNMGNALKEQGRLDEAIEAFAKAISIKPDSSEAYNNMGNAFKEQGKLKEAVGAYAKAIVINPHYPIALNNMGIVLKEQGKVVEAVEVYAKAIAMKPDYDEAYHNMSKALRGVRFFDFSPTVEGGMIAILDRKTISRPSEIAYEALSLLKCRPALQCLFFSNSGQDLNYLFETKIELLSATPPLIETNERVPPTRSGDRSVSLEA